MSQTLGSSDPPFSLSPRIISSNHNLNKDNLVLLQEALLNFGSTTTTKLSLGCPNSLSFPQHYFALDCHLIPQAHCIFPIQVTTSTATTTTIAPQLLLETNRSCDGGGGAPANATAIMTNVTISMRNPPNLMTTTMASFGSNCLVDPILFYNHLEEIWVNSGRHIT
ncbi:hypothetical protein ACA910_002170 [Epithemia clementina (nom. ined.)]